MTLEPMFAKDSTTLFRALGKTLGRKTTAFLIGGENLRSKGLKEGEAHDHDLVLVHGNDFETFVAAATLVGFKPLAEQPQPYIPGQKLQTKRLLNHDVYGLLDIFHLEIGKNLCYISGHMRNRAVIKRFGKMELGILHTSDVFLLKAVAGREKDIDALFKIAQSGPIDWDTVWSELKTQEHDTRNYISSFLLETIEDLMARGMQAPPFFKSLERRVIDKEIVRYLRDGNRPMAELVAAISGPLIKEQAVLNRIEYLKKHKVLRKIEKTDGTVILRLREKGTLNTYKKHAPASAFQMAMDCITPTANKIGLPERAKAKTIEIVNQMNEKMMFDGRKPQASVAAAMRIAMILTGVKYISVGELLEAADVSQPSYNANYRRIKTHLRL